jgi:molybdopterin molybdotransferase
LAGISTGQTEDFLQQLLVSFAALVSEAGGEPALYGIVPDRLDLLKATAAKSLAECDLVVITAGSSASARDMTAEVIGGLGAPGVLVHGINIRPGKPTILGVCEGRAVIGLPGNPVSALVIAGLFVVPVVERLLGLASVLPRPSLVARLSVNIPSQAGREDWVAVQVTRSSEGWMADPIFAKSNLIFSLASADGLIRIPPDVTGLSAGEEVRVQWL